MSLFYFSQENIESIRPLIANIVKEELTKLSETYKRMVEREKTANYVSLTQACKQLKISRQTMNNWENGLVGQKDIKPFISRVGKRKLYDVVSIQWAFNNKNANY